MAKIIGGKEIAKKMRADIEKRVDACVKNGIQPGLAVVLVGDDPASQSYVGMKGKACNELGVYYKDHILPASTPQEDLVELIEKLNEESNIHGILVQSPLPKGLDFNEILMKIDPDKDADGFHPVNVGKMVIGLDGFKPCTPYGIQQMLIHAGYSWAGKHTVIIGRSNIVGKPMMNLLVQKGDDANATVTVCHSRTKNLPELTRQADIIVAAMGVPEFIKGDMVKEGVIVIDVGSNRIDDPSTERGYRFVGDVAFDEVEPKAEAITPVPGGVGPMTITMLMHNVVWGAEQVLKG